MRLCLPLFLPFNLPSQKAVIGIFFISTSKALAFLYDTVLWEVCGRGKAWQSGLLWGNCYLIVSQMRCVSKIPLLKTVDLAGNEDFYLCTVSQSISTCHSTPLVHIFTLPLFSSVLLKPHGRFPQCSLLQFPRHPSPPLPLCSRLPLPRQTYSPFAVVVAFP